MLRIGQARCASRPQRGGGRFLLFRARKPSVPSVSLAAAAASVILSFGLARSAAALDPARAIGQYGHEVWRTDRGLPQNSVTAILQTRQGYLWLGTEEGLVRFDGARFSTFDKRNTPGLSDSFVSCLLEDRAGTLWIGTREGGLASYRDGAFRSFSTADGLTGSFVRCLAEDRDGTLWIGTDAGVTRMRGGHFSPLTSRDGLPNDAIRSLLADSLGNVWIGSRGGGLTRFAGGKLTSFSSPEGLPSPNVWTAAVARDGTLWVGTAGAGLAKFNGSRFTTISAADGLPNAFVGAIFEDRQGSLWIGTDGGGLTRMRDGKLETFTAKDGLSSDFVESIYEDREGNLWVGTQGGGLNRFKDEKFLVYGAAQGLSADAIWSIYEDPRGRVWLGTMGQGLNLMEDGRTRTFRERDGLPSNNVWCTLQTSDGALWLGSRGQGLSRWSGGQVRTWTVRDGLAANVVLALAEDRAHDLWIATAEGLNRLRLADGKRGQGSLETFTQKDGLGSSNVLSVFEDREGTLWAGTRGGGIARFSDGRFERIGVREGLAGATVYDIHQDSRGSLWFGTAGKGLLRLDGAGSGRRLTAYTTREGLFDDLIYRILEDGSGRLWMSCNRGVFRVDPADVERFDAHRIRAIPAAVYGQADGMKSPECNGGFQPAGWKTRDGRLWFPTIRGAAVIDPARIPFNAFAPPVVIEEAVADKHPIRMDGRANLAPGHSRFEFRYTALSFSAPERVAFRYKLEGFDREWIDAGTRRAATYTNLPFGEYRFRVRAGNEDGVWNEKGASLAFSIAPHFYETPWFFVLCAVAVGFAAEGATVVRVRHLKARQKELEDLVAERTRQLEEANRGLERLSLLDPLTGIANRRQFERALEFERKRSERTGSPLGLLMVDIDNFKAFNDAWGHVEGDACLKGVVAALAASMRGAGDLIARYGGEEFAVVLPGASLSGARVLAERLRECVEALRLSPAGAPQERRVTISVGVAATVDTTSISAEELVLAADRALYEAKQAGRNRVATAPLLPAGAQGSAEPD